MPAPLRDPQRQQDPTGVPTGETPDDTSLDAARAEPGNIFGEGSFLLMDPEVGTIVHAATRDQWPAEQVATALRQTNAYNEIMGRRQALADPATGETTRTELAAQLAGMLRRAPDDPMVQDWQRRLEAGGATMASIRALAEPLDQVTPTDRILEIARIHGVPMRPETAAEWAGRPEAEVDALLGELSQQLHPWKPPGIAHAAYARVFADLYGQELEQQHVAVEDPRLQRLIAEAQGDLGAFRQLVRQTPGWEDTTAGREAWEERANQVLDDLLYGQEAAQEMSKNAEMFNIQSAVGAQAAQPVGGGGTSGGGGGGGGGSYGGAQAAPNYAGLSGAESWIVSRESGGRTTADNPTSTAFGLGQLIYSNRARYAAALGVSPDTTDYNAQLQMFRMYVRDRYGTAERAKAFWQAHGWY